MKPITLLVATVLLLVRLGSEAAEGPFVSVQDAGANIAGRADAMKQAGSWKKAAANHKFQGDCVLMNERVAVVFSKGAAQVELLSVMSGNWKSRAKFAPLDLPAGKIARMGVVSIGEEAASVEVEFAEGGKSVSLVCELKPAQVYVRTAPKVGATGLRVNAPSRFGVVPDFFSDDVTMDAVKVPVESISVPSESIYLHVGVGGGDSALVGCFWSGSQEVVESISGKDGERKLENTAIQYLGKNPFITIAVLDTPNVCYAGLYEEMPKGSISVKLTRYLPKNKYKAETIEDARETRTLKWKMPYVAVWRADLPVHKDSTDPDVKGEASATDKSVNRKDNMFRTREVLMFTERKTRPSDAFSTIKEKTEQGWTFAQERPTQNFTGDNYTTTGSADPGIHPVWVSKETSEGMVTPNQENYAIVVYPFDRGKKTPLDAVTFTDLMREIIGKGPCEYVLAASAAEKHGMAACPVTEQIAKREGRIRETRKEVEGLLDQLVEFLEYCHLRQRQQSDCRKEVLAILSDSVKSNAQLAASAERISSLANRIGNNAASPTWYTSQKKTWEENIAAMKATLDSDEPEAAAKRKALVPKLRGSGGAAEGAIEGNYVILKLIRSQAGVEATLNPAFAETAKKVRAVVGKAMENPEWHENRYR